MRCSRICSRRAKAVRRVPADVMATVIVLQALYGLSDAETVDAVTFDLRWKAACGLAITAAAFSSDDVDSTGVAGWRPATGRIGFSMR